MEGVSRRAEEQYLQLRIELTARVVNPNEPTVQRDSTNSCIWLISEAE